MTQCSHSFPFLRLAEAGSRRLSTLVGLLGAIPSERRPLTASRPAALLPLGLFRHSAGRHCPPPSVPPWLNIFDPPIAILSCRLTWTSQELTVRLNSAIRTPRPLLSPAPSTTARQRFTVGLTRPMQSNKRQKATTPTHFLHSGFIACLRSVGLNRDRHPLDEKRMSRPSRT